MGVEDQMREVTNSRQLELLRSRQRFVASMEKRLNTTMVGALARFEAFFGRLWGHGGDGTLTAEQRHWLAVWKECRAEVLNNGNGQIRAVRVEARQLPEGES